MRAVGIGIARNKRNIEKSINVDGEMKGKEMNVKVREERDSRR